MKARAVVTFPADQLIRKVIEDRLDQTAQVTYLPDVAPADRIGVLSSADAVLGWVLGKGELTTQEEFEALGSAKLVQVISAGVEHLPFYLLPASVPLASNAGAWGRPIAEHVVAMTLALAKHLPQRHADLKSGWLNQQTPNRDIRGSVVGIIGFGGIGQAAAHLFKAFGARIYAINRTGETGEKTDWSGTLQDLNTLLSTADILVLCIPSNRATQALIGRRELSAMKSDAILINVARAALIDEDALFEHLECNPTFSAGIDVWWQDWQIPFTSRRPFLDLPNVIGSPHNAGNTTESIAEGASHAAANIARALRGESIQNLIDRADYVDVDWSPPLSSKSASF